VKITCFSKNIEMALAWLQQEEKKLLDLFGVLEGSDEPLDQLTPNVEGQLQKVQQNLTLLVDDRMQELATEAESLGMDSASARIRLRLWRAFQSERVDCEFCKTNCGLRMLGVELEEHDIELDTNLQILASHRICKKHQTLLEEYDRFYELFRDATDIKISVQLRDLGFVERHPPMGKTPPFYTPDTLTEYEIEEYGFWALMEKNVSSWNDLLGRTMIHQILDLYKPNSFFYLKDRMPELEKPSAYNKQDSLGRTPLYIACQKDSTSMVRQLLQEGADPTIASHRRFLPIHIAAAKGSVEICQMLRNHQDARIDICGPDSRTARDYALCNYHFSAANVLSDDYNPPGVLPTDIDIAMLAGIWSESPFSVRHAIGEGANPNASFDTTFSGGKHTENALIIALHRDKTFRVADVLLEADADLEAKTERGETALHVCVRRGDESGVRWLLENYANIMARDAKGRTALMIAAKRGIRYLIGVLLSFVKETSRFQELMMATDDKGHTALDYARWNKHDICMSILLHQTLMLDKQTQ
jgi:ankyrin repeat protein